MLKKIKNMKKNTVISIAAVLVFAILLTSGTAVFNWSGAATTQKKTTTTKVKKPGQVKGLKKVKATCKWDGARNNCTLKIKFNKVKGATGYQILIYDKKIKGCETPLLYEKTTKKTTYTIKNLTPNMTYNIKVRAYVKGKNGKVVYGKAKTIKVRMPGKMVGAYYVCNHCVAVMPSTVDPRCDHMRSVRKVHGELHSSGTFNWK